MIFKVAWQPAARNMLADLWLRSDSVIRKLINEAANEVDQLLSRDPLSEGESRPHARRIMFVPPLGIIFRVDQKANTVFILRIWPIRPRKK